MYLVSMENILCILDWGQKLSKSVLCVISFNPVSFFNTLANQFLPLCVSPEFHYLIIRCYLYFSISMSIRHVEFNCSESNYWLPSKTAAIPSSLSKWQFSSFGCSGLEPSRHPSLCSFTSTSNQSENPIYSLCEIYQTTRERNLSPVYYRKFKIKKE